MMPHKPYRLALCWLRRDLRDYDHAALALATQMAEEVIPLFVFDRDILDTLTDRKDRRVSFIWQSVAELRESLQARGGDLWLRHDSARMAVPRLARELGVEAVFCAEDYEQFARERDGAVAAALQAEGMAFHRCKDQVIFAADEVLNRTGRPYAVFTPYSHAWLGRFGPADCAPHVPDWQALSGRQDTSVLEFAALGFDPSELPPMAGMKGAATALAEFMPQIDRYGQQRDFPALPGTSHLAVHLRFGTVSVRQLARLAWQHGGEGATAWLRALIWRDFFFMLLQHFPQVEQGCFHVEFDQLRWDDHPDWFAAWCAGQTGYPLVDAGMRELKLSGMMHNRVRMVVASFLTKDLGIDWRQGERFFADHLLDYDLAANNGNWQWAASTGCDAQPWFRIFNPLTQSEKFDAHGQYIRRWVPELADVPDKYIHAPWTMPPMQQQLAGCVIGQDYPAPIVDHALARERTLARYKAVKKETNNA